MADSIVIAAPPLEIAPHPYPPSWVDRLIDWVERRPGPAWLFYAGLAVVELWLFLRVAKRGPDPAPEPVPGPGGDAYLPSLAY